MRAAIIESDFDLQFFITAYSKCPFLPLFFLPRFPREGGAVSKPSSSNPGNGYRERCR
jgi:hypothetical protein